MVSVGCSPDAEMINGDRVESGVTVTRGFKDLICGRAARTRYTAQSQSAGNKRRK